ncbi:alkaline phosphatase family protein [Ideonella sp. DXS29W]|uniref:Alkaline phosphatase family protein n=1 Tax=Ideonella lacteola TaxID=2984193 RepID=A0ABU9BK17_9BURK
MAHRLQAAALALTVALVTSASAQPADDPAIQPVGPAASAIKVIFVIAFENHDSKQIYGNTADAPYINNVLMQKYAYSTNFGDVLPSLPSEPHYVWMEAGTNKFSDHTFTGDGDATASNSTGSTAHLVTQIKNAGTGISWMSYQEGLNKRTGRCPIASDGYYAAKHNPFVFFRDVSGNPPSKTNTYCADHHKNYKALADDLANARVATFNFITPNQCNDMHGDIGCPNSNEIRAGDNWLKKNLPPIIDYVNAHQGAIFLVWDEGSNTNLMPFIAVGPGVKKGYASSVKLDHSSLLKSVEEILQLPLLATVSGATDFADLFQAGQFP